MQVSLKLYINNSSKLGHPLIVYFKDVGVRKRITVGKFLKNDMYYFKKNEWDSANEIPLNSCRNFDVIFPKLINWRKQFEALMLKNETDVNAYLSVLSENDKALEIALLEKRLANLKNENTIGVLSFFDVVIAEKLQKNESVDMYKQTKNEIEKFIIDDCSLNAINYEWLHSFIIYKKKEGAKEAGIMVYLRTLRALYKEAQKRDSMNVKNNNPFLNLIKNVSVPVEVDFKLKYFKKINNYKPKESTSKVAAFKMKRNIDLWIFQFAIGGHDFADIASLTWKQLKNERIIFRRFKNRSKPQGGPQINNKLFPVALEIINKYGNKKSERVFDFIPMPTDLIKYKTFRGNFNRSLRTISNDLDLPTILKSKTTRYIFRSLAGELLISDLVIMQLQGHKPKGVSFGYQKSLQNSIIDKFLKKILKKADLY